MIITREDEMNFPDFNNFEDARKYFINRYGERYNLGHSEMIGDELMYFDDVGGQSVQIFESGFVHVVY